MTNRFFRDGGISLNRRQFLKVSAAAGGTMLISNPSALFAQTKQRISIATGGMGGVYFVMGGGIASLLTKYAGVEAAAEVTAASVDNCKLMGAKKSDLGFVMGDTAYDAFKGLGVFNGKPLAVRTLAILYPGYTHLVVKQGSGMSKVSDLKGKRVSTGAPGSGTEVMALRVLEAGGINHEKDIKKDRLGASESAGALKDGKIDAFFFTGGVPTGAILDLSATPGITISVVAHDELIPAMVAKSGPIYYRAVIPKKVYSGVDGDVPVSAVGNLLMTYQDLDETLAYNIMKTLFDHVPDLVAIHKEAQSINLKDAASEKGVPYHKGAQKFFKEKGLDVPA
jgi:hypothetical protein